MKELNTKVIAVLTDQGCLNIHLIDIDKIKLTSDEKLANNEGEAIESYLSGFYDLDSIQWQQIMQINFNYPDVFNTTARHDYISRGIHD